jgi:hypothetical protein
MNLKKKLLSLSIILLFSLTCDEAALPKDCLGDEGGTAYIDECGVCDTDSNNDNVTCFDCTGQINGSYILDECNICNIYTSYGGIKPNYPYGDCDCKGVLDGTSTTDNCGICDDDITNNCLIDCNNVWGGTAEEDECGVCDEDSTNDNITCVQDCAGTWGGTAEEDECGVCDSNIENNCIQDCAGTWGGTAINDGCGVCNGDNTTCQAGCTDENACNYDSSIDPSNDDGSCTFADLNYDCDGNCTTFDCNGDCGGSASIDCSGECSGGDTGIAAYTICGCFDTNADNFYCHLNSTGCYDNPSVDTCCENNTSVDASCNVDCIYSPNTGSQYSNPFIDSDECEYSPNVITINQGCVNGYENPNYGLVYNDTSVCEYYGCTDESAINYDEAATNCFDNTSSCCSYPEVSIYFGEITSSTIEIFMQNSEEVGGFQFSITGATINSGNEGSAEENGLTVNGSSSGTVLGFTFTDSSIPIGDALLTILSATDVSEPICMNNFVISDTGGNNLNISSNSVCSDE